MTSKEIRQHISEIKSEMKSMVIRRISCMNSGLSSLEYAWNSRLMQMNLKLSLALIAEQK